VEKKQGAVTVIIRGEIPVINRVMIQLAVYPPDLFVGPSLDGRAEAYTDYFSKPS